LPGTDLVQKRGHVFDLDSLNLVYIAQAFAKKGKKKQKNELRQAANDSCLPIYKTIPAICNFPRQTYCIRNSIFPHFLMVIMVRVVGQVVVCGCVLLRSRQGAPKLFRKLLLRRNQSSGNITGWPHNYSNFFPRILDI
jgi:hypothetical protein